VIVSNRPAHLAVAAASLVLPASLPAAILRTAQPYLGVTHYQYLQLKSDTTSQPAFPREIVVNILAIDVTTPGLQFLMQPGNGALPGEVTRTTTSSFVNSVNAQIGINTGFYDTVPPYPSPYTDLNFITASNGSVYSTAAGGETLFNITASNVPSIRTAGAAGSTTATGNFALYNATGGNLRILTNGALVNTTGSYATTLNPHSAIGVSQDQKRVFLLTVDGRQTDFSEGMYTYEMAQLLLDLGAYNAINLDGGGSTTLVMDDSNDGAQNARIINSPSDGASSTGPGSERLIANSLAVFAPFNPAYVPLPALAYPGQTGVVSNVTRAAFLDRFTASAGHFASGATGSGSNRNVAAATAVSVDTTRSVEGGSSLRLDIVNTNAATPQMQLRLLSGGGSPANNLFDDGSAMGSSGYLGLWLLLPAGSPALYVSVLLDDGTTTSTGLERAAFKQLTADGLWHLYEWALFDPNLWTNFSGGNGAIDGPNVFLDSVYFSSTNATSGGPNFSGSVWLDALTYNPLGPTAPLVPEPSTALAAGLLLLPTRRRAHRQ
jgi:hypothetical protein